VERSGNSNEANEREALPGSSFGGIWRTQEPAERSEQRGKEMALLGDLTADLCDEGLAASKGGGTTRKEQQETLGKEKGECPRSVGRKQNHQLGRKVRSDSNFKKPTHGLCFAGGRGFQHMKRGNHKLKVPRKYIKGQR